MMPNFKYVNNELVQLTDAEETAFKADQDACAADKAANGYKDKRAEKYPSITEQLDQLYWDKKNGTNKWVEAIDKVKSDNPKP